MKLVLLQVVMHERMSVIWLVAAETDFVALPIKFEQLKVSFALQKIPLSMKRHAIWLRRCFTLTLRRIA
jgi:translation elongation factor EF-Ts